MKMNSRNSSNTALEQIVFGWIDYVLFSSLIGISLGIGIFFGFFRKQNSTIEYLFGGKQMGYIPVSISILASTISAMMLLGFPTEVYAHGAYAFLFAIPQFVVGIITVYIFMPVYYKLQLSSTYEYLELRFSKNVRSFASIMYAFSMLVYIPLVIFVPALAFAQMTGFSLHILTPILCLICITYTSMGGVKAVVWSDAIQFLFTMAGFITLIILGTISTGGFIEVWRRADVGGRLDIFNFDPNPVTRDSFGTATWGLLFAWLGAYGVSQKIIQRLLSIEKQVDINKAISLTTFGMMIANTMCAFLGLLIYAKYQNCDPITAEMIERTDQIMPYYMMDIAGNIPGLPGLFLAGITSSALSAMSAALNALSGMIYEDFIKGWLPDGPKNNAKATKIMKILSVLIGLITIGLIFIMEYLGTIFELAVSMKSSFDGPLTGLFILGTIFPMVGTKGAFCGGFSACIFMSWIVIGNKWNIMNKRIQYPNLPMSIDGCSDIINQTVISNVTITSEDEAFVLFRISMLYMTFFGCFITVVVGIIISYATGEYKTVKVHLDHIAPFIRRFLSEKRYTEIAMHDTPSKE